MRADFAIFILSHGRSEILRTKTLATLKRSGYTGDWFVVLDDEDTTRPAYEAIAGPEHVLTFTKDDTAQDLGDNWLGPRGIAVYARNAIPRLARERGVAYYMLLDDDYHSAGHRFTVEDAFPGEAERMFEEGWTRNRLQLSTTVRLDEILDATIQLMEDTGALTVAFAQGGDYFGGAAGKSYRSGLLRKAMNTFICRTDRPVYFMGRMNEDVNAYVVAGARGELLFTTTDFYVGQSQTQQNEGGFTEAYLDTGTYVKSFYSVMYAPSCVKVVTMGERYRRVHHRVKWGHAVPKIVSGRYRKPDA